MDQCVLAEWITSLSSLAKLHTTPLTLLLCFYLLSLSAAVGADVFLCANLFGRNLRC